MHLLTLNLEEAHPMCTPLDPNVILSKSLSPDTNHEKAQMKGIPYLTVVGSIMYVEMGMHIDVAFTVQHLSQFSSNMAKLNGLCTTSIYMPPEVIVKNRFSDPTKVQEGRDRPRKDVMNRHRGKALSEGCRERKKAWMVVLGVSALHYSTGSTEGLEGFGCWLQLMRCA